jgi:hypothetical protein
MIDERKQRRALIERSIFASCAGDQQQARQLSAELVILATARALPEIQRRGRETVANLRRFEASTPPPLSTRASADDIAAHWRSQGLTA